MTPTETDSLLVWTADRLVGRVWRHRLGLGFRYHREWVEEGFAISCSLPLRPDPFSPEDGIAHNFFANLLPEGGVREQIVRDLKIANSDFELLRAIGGECAGALSLLPVGREPSRDQTYVTLSDEQLSDLVRNRGQVYASYPPGERPRLSLAGAQNKLAVLVRDNEYLLPRSEAPSSHILKFEVEGYRHIPANETFTTMLAAGIGMPVVEIELLLIDGERCSLTKRYDRYPDESGRVHRLHQEDFCQALGYPSDKKYQDAGGPSFADCYRALRDLSTEPARDTLELLRWQVFNLLAGNSDGHAKNLSLLHPRAGVARLAQFYDLVCTRAIARIDHHLAFDIGGERDPGRIRADHWDRMATQCDIRPSFLRGLVEETATSIANQIGSVRESFEMRFGPYPALQQLETVVRKQCKRTLRTLRK